MDAFGIDIGGSGIKGAPVDLKRGCFAEERLRIPTPAVSTPEAVSRICCELLEHFSVGPDVPVGVAFPAPVYPGRPIGFMSNLDQSWVGVDITAKLSEACRRSVHVVNDADAAGLAESLYGEARRYHGLVVTVTLGTGIGTALVMDGKLIPNSELGHILMGKHARDAETLAADSARQREDLTWKKWGKRVNKYLRLLEFYLSPEAFIVGGGVSKKHEKFFPYINVSAPLYAAALLNDAGIVGAAAFASQQR